MWRGVAGIAAAQVHRLAEHAARQAAASSSSAGPHAFGSPATGLPHPQVVFFSQGALPALTEGGRIIMEGPSRLAMAPDGNGGVYMALRAQGATRGAVCGERDVKRTLQTWTDFADAVLVPNRPVCLHAFAHLALTQPAHCSLPLPQACWRTWRRTALRPWTATAWTTLWCACCCLRGWCLSLQ